MNTHLSSLTDIAVAAKLAALGHPTRIRILCKVADCGNCCCKDVVSDLDLAQSTVSQHLRVLVDAGLLRFRQDRQHSRYEVDQEALAGLSRSLSEIADTCCKPGCGR